MDRLAFWSLWQTTWHRARQLAKRTQTLEIKVASLVGKALREDASVEQVGPEIRRLVPDKAQRDALCRKMLKMAEARSKQTAEASGGGAPCEATRAPRKGVSKAHLTALRALDTLWQAVLDGDGEGMSGLVEVSLMSAQLLSFAEKLHPELVRPFARGQMHWPVLLSAENSWEKKAAERVAGLELGADLPCGRPRFRQARGADANYPARLWAKAAVRTIMETRLRGWCFGQLCLFLGSAAALADLSLRERWRMIDIPEWASDLPKLKPFSRDSLPQWKSMVRNLIRDQVPNFHTLPEWKAQRNTAAASGRDTAGEIRNAILDDILSALERLAPDPVCGSSPAEFQQAK